MPDLGEEIYSRLAQPPIVTGPPAGVPPVGVRLAARIAQRLTSPYGRGGAGAAGGLAAQIMARMGGGGAGGGRFAPPLMVMRKTEMRLTEPGHRFRRAADESGDAQ